MSLTFWFSLEDAFFVLANVLDTTSQMTGVIREGVLTCLAWS
jgi:hypothetical protein